MGVPVVERNWWDIAGWRAVSERDKWRARKRGCRVSVASAHEKEAQRL